MTDENPSFEIKRGDRCEVPLELQCLLLICSKKSRIRANTEITMGN